MVGVRSVRDPTMGVCAGSTDLRIAHIEGTLEQMDKRLSSVERRLDGIDTKFNWVIGLILTSWITIVGLLVAVVLRMK